jgi:transposase
MHHKQGEDRNQMFMFSLESAIAADSFVRVVDTFVDAINLKSFGFAHVECEEEGRPPYHPSALLKLYLYGYRHGIIRQQSWLMSSSFVVGSYHQKTREGSTDQL